MAPDALVGGSKGNHLLLLGHGHVSDSSFLRGRMLLPPPRVEDGQARSHSKAMGLVSSNHVQGSGIPPQNHGEQLLTGHRAPAGATQ